MTARDDSTPPAAQPGNHRSGDDAALAPEQDRRSVWPVAIRVVLFIVGCALLIGCAFSINHLSQWMHDYGTVWVFLGFFLVMSLAGRWFWVGADAALDIVLHGSGRK